MERFGLVRGVAQTQREFARDAHAALLDSTGNADLALLPAEVVEVFYRVRFGHAALDNPQREAVERALGKLADAAVKGKP